MGEDLATVKIEGLDKLQAALKSFPLAVARRCFRESLHFAAQAWQQEMEVKAPKLDKPKFSLDSRDVRLPGDLSRNIGMRLVVNSDLQASVQVGPSKRTFWGLFQELGRRASQSGAKMPKWLGGGGRRSHGASYMQARPFVRPAFESQSNNVVNRLADNLTQVIAEEVEKHV